MLPYVTKIYISVRTVLGVGVVEMDPRTRRQVDQKTKS